jgi:hypothetical protein
LRQGVEIQDAIKQVDAVARQRERRNGSRKNEPCEIGSGREIIDVCWINVSREREPRGLTGHGDDSAHPVFLFRPSIYPIVSTPRRDGLRMCDDAAREREEETHHRRECRASSPRMVDPRARNERKSIETVRQHDAEQIATVVP